MGCTNFITNVLLPHRLRIEFFFFFLATSSVPTGLSQRGVFKCVKKGANQRGFSVWLPTLPILPSPPYKPHPYIIYHVMNEEVGPSQ